MGTSCSSLEGKLLVGSVLSMASVRAPASREVVWVAVNGFRERDVAPTIIGVA